MLGTAWCWLTLACFPTALLPSPVKPADLGWEQPAPIQCLIDLEEHLVRVRSLTRTLIDPKVPGQMAYEYTYGTGVILDEDGTIATADHLVHDRQKGKIGTAELEVLLSSSHNYLPVDVVDEDSVSDVALLRINPRALSGRKYLSLATAALPRPGEPSYVVGLRAGARADYFEMGVVRGVFVDAQRRMAELARKELGPGPWVTISQMILPGYSGGAILDASGNLVGIVGGAPELKGKWVEFSYGTGIEAVLRLRDKRSRQ